MVREYIGLIAGEVDAIQILRLATRVGNAVSIAEERYVKTDDARTDGECTPDQRPVKQR